MRERALELAAVYGELARAHEGLDRQSYLDASSKIAAEPQERKLAAGLQKLVLDRCTFEEQAALDPATLRKEIFARAAEARRTLADGHRFDRENLLAGAAATFACTPEALEQTLYADLPSAHILRKVAVPSPERLVALFELGQVEAVLLRATRLRVRLSDAAPDAYRHLFRKLKFLQLLFTLVWDNDTYVLDVDGPVSLFESSTRYGLKLALALPAIRACGTWRVDAEILWGHDRRPLGFSIAGAAPPGLESEAMAELPEPLRLLVDRTNELATPWRASPSTQILDLPGLGVVVPDLSFTHASGQVVHFELLGFWSRDAVWRRVELAEAGLPEPIVFGVSKNLRVSESVLDDEHIPAALYVFANIPSAKAVLQKIEAVAKRAGLAG